MSQLTNVVGAIVSVALMAGIGVWGYKLFVRDVSGIPVVRAIEGEMRIAPKDPGGAQADHQGLAVNSVTAEGTAEAPADRLVLAPRPVDLKAEDVPVLASDEGQAAPPVAQAPQNATAAPDVSGAQIAQSDGAGAVTEPETEAEAQARSIEALVAELTNGVEPLSNVVPTEAAPVVTSVAEISEEATASEGEAPVVPAAIVQAPGVQQSPRPRPRPSQAQLENVVQVAAVSTSAPLDADSIVAGTRMVQLGAFDSEEVASAEWGRLTGRFSDYMEDKQSVIQRASSGGRVFYRLRAVGFEDLSDARRFCSALVAENADCIPVIAR